MEKNIPPKYYDLVKEHGGRTYTGMAVGGRHEWDYKEGKWSEKKVSPDKWTFTFDCDKHRARHAPAGTGAAIGTQYHWYIVADQRVTKLDEDTYRTAMCGVKFKVGHKRPYWHQWSYDYQDHGGACYEDIVIAYLQGIIQELEAKKKRRGLDAFLLCTKEGH